MEKDVFAAFEADVAALVAAGEVAAPSPLAADQFAEFARFTFDLAGALQLGAGASARLAALDTFVKERREFFKNRLPAPSAELARNAWLLMVKKQRSAYERRRAARGPVVPGGGGGGGGMKRPREHAVEELVSARDLRVVEEVLPREMLGEIVSHVEHPGILVRLELAAKALAAIADRQWSQVALRMVRGVGAFANYPPVIPEKSVRELRAAFFAMRDSGAAVLPDAQRVALGVLHSIADRMGYATVHTLREYKDIYSSTLALYERGDSAGDDDEDGDGDDNNNNVELLHLTFDTPVRFELPARSPLLANDALVASVHRFNASVLAEQTFVEPDKHGFNRIRVLNSLLAEVQRFFFRLLMDYSPLLRLYNEIEDEYSEYIGLARFTEAAALEAMLNEGLLTPAQQLTWEAGVLLRRA